jgi:hypothetical protein
MGMKQTLGVLNRMEAEGIIGQYAISGAFAAYYYVEPTVTEDLDVLITLAPIFSYLREKGYDEHRKEGIVIEGWPVQFLPVASDLDAEALAQAKEIEIPISEAEGTVKTRILRPEHIVAISLGVRRPKDFLRIAQFLEEEAVDRELLSDVLARHALTDAWKAFCKRAGIDLQNVIHIKT